MKKIFLFVALVGMFVGNTFGSASFRMQQPVTGALTSNSMRYASARAGTLKIPKTTSNITSEPPTIPTSLGTYARQPVSKITKNISTSKTKNTTNQELNNIGSRIDELQSKLELAEATQTKIITTDDIDAKITEKLQEIGTNNTTDTYSKKEVDELFQEIVKKLPQIDDRGNINMIDPNGQLVAVQLYWMNLLYTTDLYVNNGRRFKYGTSYVYETNKTEEAIQQYVASTVCNGETSYWCWIQGISNTGTTKQVTVIRFDHGYGQVEGSVIYWGTDPSSQFYDPQTNDTTHTLYWSFEDSPAQYIRNAVCGNKPETDCFIATGNMRAFSGGLNVNVYGHTTQLTEIVERGQHTGNNFSSSLIFQGFHLVNQYRIAAAASVTESEIAAYVTEFCDGESDFFCYIRDGQITTLPSGTKMFFIVQRLHGYGLLDTTMLELNGRTWLNKIYYTNEQNPASYIQNIVCANKPETDCYVAEWWDMIPINNNIQPGLGEQGARYQVSIMDAVATKSSVPTGNYIPLTAK